MPPRIFISYAREDQKTANAIAEQLEQLSSIGVADIWIDRAIELGESWEQAIAREAGRADVVLALVSPAYLAPGFAYDRELRLIEAAHERGARVVPVIIEDCVWQSDRFLGSVQAFAGGRALQRPTTVTFRREVATLVEELRLLVAGRGPSATVAVEAGREPERGPGSPRPATTDPSGLARKGSQLQTQLYVNRRSEELERACLGALQDLPDAARIEWRSPLASEGYAEYRDADFLGAVGLGDRAGSLRRFWPARGPRWDALAIISGPGFDGTGVILAEGKSYPQEMRSTCRATGESREQIRTAMRTAQEVLGVNAPLDSWLDGHYQLANRVSHLAWLLSEGVEAWLVQLLFVGDPHRPTSEGEWTRAIAAARHELGIDGVSRIGEVVLEALDPSASAG